MRVAVVGSCLVDLSVRPAGELVPDTSNQAEVVWGAGGAGRNVAEDLARLGAEVTMVTDLGGDLPARWLQESLEGLGVRVRIARTTSTGVYVALLHPDGRLQTGLCQTATEWLGASEVLAALPDLSTYDGVVLDANLSGAALGTLAAACRAAGVPYALEPVAAGKAGRLLSALDGCALVKPDRPEAAALTGQACVSIDDAARCARTLREGGAGTVIVSLGADGLWVESDTVSHHLPALPATVVDVTGAGDALFAAVFAGMLRGLPLGVCLDAGRHAAALTCASPTATSPALSPAIFQEARPT